MRIITIKLLSVILCEELTHARLSDNLRSDF